MSNQVARDREGLTLTVIGQVVDITYHGVVPVTDIGNGILAQMLQPVTKQRDSGGGSPPHTTKSSLVNFIPIENVPGEQEYLDSLKLVRAGLIASHAEVNAKVENFHKRLNELKKGLLKGKTRNTVTKAELEMVRSQMTDFQVGKVLKIKLQARIFSTRDLPGYRPVQTGGFSRLGVLFTFYVPYQDEFELQFYVDKIALSFRNGDMSNQDLVARRQESIVEEDENGKITITPGRAQVAVRYRGDGQGRSRTILIEDIRKTNAFGIKALDLVKRPKRE